MKKYFWLPVLLVSLIGNAYFIFQNKKEERTENTYTVLRVIDGDTFDVTGDIRIRLAGANAPEYPKGCLSEEAKQRLTNLLAGKTVTTVLKEEDDFGRAVSFVFTDDLFVDQALVSEGLAKASEINDPEFGAKLLGSEEEAKAAERGIWSAKCLSPPDPTCTIKGNVRRDRKTKIYHLPNCFNYQKIVIDEREGDSWFCSEKEAEEAGFTRSEDCPE